MTDSLEVATSERVALSLPIAGLGSRAMAYVIDVSLLGALALVAYFVATFFIADMFKQVMDLSGLVRTLGALGVFFALWGYWTFFEVRWNGQTLGKRLVHIRVVRHDGSPVTVFASATRNLIRVIDFLPVFYPVGLTSMLIDAKHRRLGDLVAGTLLVRDEQIDLSRYEQVQAVNVGVTDVEIATSYLRRFEQFDAASRVRLGQQLAARLGLPLSDDALALRDAIAGKLNG